MATKQRTRPNMRLATPSMPVAEPVEDETTVEDDTVDVMVPWQADPAFAFEGLETSDGRTLMQGSIVFTRSFPLPLMYLDSTPEWGHMGAVLVGRIDMAEMRDGELYAEGVIDTTSPDGQAAVRNIGSALMNRISVDIAPLDAEQDNGKILIHKGELLGATIVAMSAFGEAKIRLADDPVALVAAGFPPPQAEHFTHPATTQAEPVVVEGDHIHGYVATWNTCHTMFLDKCVLAPRSQTDYAFFNRKPTTMSDGQTINVGVLTLDANHADMRMSAQATRDHYEHTGTVVADVVAGEDEYGIWISGQVRPYVSDVQRLKMERCEWSGDWRPSPDNLELFAILGVNTAGFPVLKAGYVEGRQVSLVASAFIPEPEQQPEPETPPYPVAKMAAQLETTAKLLTAMSARLDDIETRAMLDELDRIVHST